MRIIKKKLPETPEIQAIKADAIRMALIELQPKHAPGFELYVDEILAKEYLRSGEIQPNPKCKSCFGRGKILKLVNPGKKAEVGKAPETAEHPCSCIMGQYYKRKPENEVILPAGEYGKPLEPPATVPENEAKPRRKKPVQTGDGSPDAKPETVKRVRKKRTDIPGKNPEKGNQE